MCFAYREGVNKHGIFNLTLTYGSDRQIKMGNFWQKIISPFVKMKILRKTEIIRLKSI